MSEGVGTKGVEGNSIPFIGVGVWVGLECSSFPAEGNKLVAVGVSWLLTVFVHPAIKSRKYKMEKSIDLFFIATLLILLRFL